MKQESIANRFMTNSNPSWNEIVKGKAQKFCLLAASALLSRSLFVFVPCFPLLPLLSSSHSNYLLALVFSSLLLFLLPFILCSSLFLLSDYHRVSPFALFFSSFSFLPLFFLFFLSLSILWFCDFSLIITNSDLSIFFLFSSYPPLSLPFLSFLYCLTVLFCLFLSFCYPLLARRMIMTRRKR